MDTWKDPFADVPELDQEGAGNSYADRTSEEPPPKKVKVEPKKDLVDAQAAEIEKLKKLLQQKQAAQPAAAAAAEVPTEFKLSRTKRVSVSKYRGKVLVDIREIYQKDDGSWAPGRKGISLNEECWGKLKDIIESGAIDEAIDSI